MIVDWLFVLVGLLFLLAGGEALVRGASGIALLARVAPAVVGLTVVAAGTSMPELVVSVQSALGGNPALAAGNVVGSNIFNIGAIVGLTAMVTPLSIQSSTLRFEWPVMMLAALSVLLFSRDLVVGRGEGVGLLVALVAFVGCAVWLAKRGMSEHEREEFGDVETASFGKTGALAVGLNVAAVLLGMGCLALGSTALVRGAASIARDFGVSQAVIGLTIVAAGTSTPELVTSLVAAKRGQDDIAVGNVVGSNVFNVLCILGTTAVITPLRVPAEIVRRDNWWMAGFSMLLFPLMKTKMSVSRMEGVLLFALFLFYMAVLVQAL